MASRFVSGGTDDAPITRDAEWLSAQASLEAERRAKAEAVQASSSSRSLFETLEANKASKQEAFEEAAKLKHQFRALDEDEIEFLDEVLESTRREEDRIRQETEEGLEAFRRRREENDRLALAAAEGVDGQDTGDAEDGEDWGGKAGVGRKRKGKAITEEKPMLGENPKKEVKDTTADTASNSVKKKSVVQPQPKTETSKPELAHSVAPAVRKTPSEEAAPAPVTSKGGLGLVDYGSSDDEDE